jgi:hypothetical protein
MLLGKRLSRQFLCMNHRCDRLGLIESSTSAKAARACVECSAPMWEPSRAAGVRYFGWTVVSKANATGNWWAVIINPWTGRIHSVVASVDAMKVGAKARKVIDAIREDEEMMVRQRAS